MGSFMFLLERLCISLSDNIFQVNSNQALLNLKVNPGWVALLDIRLHQVMGYCTHSKALHDVMLAHKFGRPIYNRVEQS